MKPLFLIGLIVVSFSAFSQPDLKKGLVAYYPFNGNEKDQSGNGNNPVFNNATLTTDHNGNPKSAYHFNGKNTYMKVPNAPSLNMANKMSIALWVRPTGYYTGPCYNNMMIMKGDGDYLEGNYFIRFSDVITGCTDPKTSGEQFYGQGAVAALPIITLNKWYCVVWTYDGSTARIYVDCQLRASNVGRFRFVNEFDLFIGRMFNTQYPYWLNGDLDEIRIYNRALTEEEIKLYSECPEKVASPCIGNQRPSASFNYTVTKCRAVNFELKNSSATNARSVNWLFGDGSSSIAKTPVHTFPKSGTFTVKAIVTNTQGCKDTVSKTVQLADIKTDFSFQEKGDPGEIEFRAKNNDATYNWDFGNGESANSAALTSTVYHKSGTYNVKMSAMNNVGCTTTVTKKINVRLPDSIQIVQPPVKAPDIINNQPDELPEKREKDIQTTVRVKRDSVVVSVYDNGLVDGDSVTLVFNDKIIVSHLLLSGQPYSFVIRIDPARASNQILMYAENLGTIPPNTASMIINDGDRRAVNITSNKNVNGVVSFILEKQ